MTETPEPKPRNFYLTIDLRDVAGAAGLALILIGAATIHWGLALAVAGAGLFALAYSLS